MTERSQKELLQDSIWTITFGWRRHKWLHAEAKALLDAYFETNALLGEALIKAKRAADDAAAQRALVELLTNELDQKQKGHG